MLNAFEGDAIGAGDGVEEDTVWAAIAFFSVGVGVYPPTVVVVEAITSIALVFFKVNDLGMKIG